MNFSQAPQIIDWSHASQHLWTVANEVFGEHTPPAQQWAERQLDRLWNGQVIEVVATLDSLNLDQERWSLLVRQAPDYFRSRQRQMQYDRFRAEGFPIGSGTVESAANTVIHHRLKRPGRGWKCDDAQAMLAALSELHGGLSTGLGRLPFRWRFEISDSFAVYPPQQGHWCNELYRCV